LTAEGKSGIRKQRYTIMVQPKTDSDSNRRAYGASADALQAKQAEKAGPKFEWHYGRVTRLGSFTVGVDREVTIVWEEGGITSQQGDITDFQWEVFKLAFLTSGRIEVLSDQEGDGWMYDYRFLETVR
jgi:hypothetical protein